MRIALLLGLVAYNNAANFWPPFNRGFYVPANLAAASAVAAIALGPMGLDRTGLGLGDPSLGDAVFGLALGAGLATPLFLALTNARTAGWIADRRVMGLSGRRLAYQTLVRVPLGTALLEELAFRGALYAVWLPTGSVVSAVVSSVAFGLWHIGPSVNMTRANRPGASAPQVALVAAGTVVVTAGAGLGLIALRVETGSILAPLVLHATLNSLATVAGVLASRRAAV